MRVFPEQHNKQAVHTVIFPILALNFSGDEHKRNKNKNH